MKSNRKDSNSYASYIRYAVISLAVVLLLLRFIKLDIDPPYFFTGYTQAHLTDPYHLTFAARNAVLFGDWHPFDYHRWDVFTYSLVSGTAYILFTVFGVSRVTANCAGLFLNIGGMLFFLLGFVGFRKTREIGFTLLLLLLSGMLFYYGRLPFLENGVIFLSGLTFLLLMRLYHKWWGRFLAGFAVAMAALAGKLFGLILLGPVIVTLIYIYRKEALRPCLIAVAGCVAGVLLYALLFYGGRFEVMISYYNEQTMGMYGTPRGFGSLAGFFVQFLSFGEENGFIAFSPFMISLALAGAILFLLTATWTGEMNLKVIPLIFAYCWIIFGVAGLMPFNYRPLRYAIFLFLPVTAVAGYGIETALEKNVCFQLRRKAISLPLILLMSWYIITLIITKFLPSVQRAIAGKNALYIILAAALLVTGAVYLWLRKRRRRISRSLLLLFIIPLLVGAIIKQAILIYEGLALPGTYLKDYNREISELVDDEAVLTGPYMPAFTIDNRLRGVIYVFGLSNVERDLFNRFPITHIVADPSNRDLAVRDYPVLDSVLDLRQMRIRDGSIGLMRLAHATVPLTDFEKAFMSFTSGRFDSALAYSEHFAKRYPDNLSGLFGLVVAYYTVGQKDMFMKTLQSLPERFPDNFRVHKFCKDFYELAYRATKEARFQKLIDYHTRRAKEINPAFGK
ncbi:MAG: hypothetical protein JSV44_10255 [Candidatus Zixiibacteriota bacterium]|nr:MAG: hypothetical protein JSV44_10255 [candidate division Zixibacteria bacterium]